MLPSALLPKNWPGAALRTRYDDYDVALRRLLREFFTPTATTLPREPHPHAARLGADLELPAGDAGVAQHLRGEHLRVDLLGHGQHDWALGDVAHHVAKDSLESGVEADGCGGHALMMQGGCDIKSGRSRPMGPLVDFAQVAIDASPDVLLVIDAEGILRWASPSLASLGYDPVGQVGVQVLDYVHPDDLGYALGMLTEAVRRPGEHSLPVFRVQHGAGHTVEVEASVANVADGEFEGLLLVLRQVATRGVLPGRRRGLERLLQEVAARCAGAVGEDVAYVIPNLIRPTIIRQRPISRAL